ncbi:MAG: hypothetical protein HWE22_02260 [Flavobacteriales bacterium]|nr:hypothetical protein [Flavobacteriales bacterium]
MDFKWLFLGLSLAFVSCAEMKESAEIAADNAVNIWQGKQKLTVTFQSHRPYCGGAAPTEEQAKGFTEPMANQVFYLYKDERPNSVTDMVKVTTDESGTFSIDLKDGRFSIISEDKALPLKEFIKKKKIEGEFYEYSDDSCFETWRTTPEFTIDLSHPTDEVVTIKTDCYTGDNPCMQYTGPYRP